MEIGTMTLEGIEYEVMAKPSPEELLEFYERQHHDTTHDTAKLQRMIDHTFCFVTARQEGRLIGMARGITDGVRGKLAECKLDPAHQGPACVTKVDGRIEHDSAGIAKEMAQRVIDALLNYGVEHIEAIAYGTEVDFCEELGFKAVKGRVAMDLIAGLPGEA